MGGWGKGVAGFALRYCGSAGLVQGLLDGVGAGFGGCTIKMRCFLELGRNWARSGFQGIVQCGSGQILLGGSVRTPGLRFDVKDGCASVLQHSAWRALSGGEGSFS